MDKLETERRAEKQRLLRRLDLVLAGPRVVAAAQDLRERVALELRKA